MTQNICLDLSTHTVPTAPPHLYPIYPSPPTPQKSNTMCKRMEIVDDSLRKLFRKLGECIGVRPGYFIIVPILISALCASGFQRIVFEADPEYLFSPVDGQVRYNAIFYVNLQVAYIFCNSFRTRN